MRSLSILSFLLLVGCGGEGGSDGNEPDSPNINPPEIITNNPPTINEISDIKIFRNESLTIPVNINDVDGDILKLTAESNGSDLLVDVVDSLISINAINDFNGDVKIVVSVSDGIATVDTDFIITVMQAPAPPKALVKSSNIPTPPILPSI